MITAAISRRGGKSVIHVSIFCILHNNAVSTSIHFYVKFFITTQFLRSTLNCYLHKPHIELHETQLNCSQGEICVCTGKHYIPVSRSLYTHNETN
jgi:hypothetical protein